MVSAVKKERKSKTFETVKYLVEQGAEINPKSGSSLTYALQNIELVRYLVEHGVNVNAIDRQKILMLAVFAGDLEVIRYLIERGANMDYRDRTGETA